MLCWTGAILPCENSQLNFLEMSNEILVLVSAYSMMLFTDYVADPNLRYMFGWGYIGLIGFGLLFNLLFMFFTSLKDIKKLYLSIRHWNRNMQAQKKKTVIKEGKEEVVDEEKPVNTFEKLFKQELTTEALAHERDLSRWFKKQIDFKQSMEEERK